MTTLYDLDAVTERGYRIHTGDVTTAGTTVTGALVEAEELLNDELGRKLALDEYTGTFPIYPDGRIYPDAWPITAADQTIEGRALLGSTADVTVFVGYFGDCYPNRATITWTGGYDDGTNGTWLPIRLRHAIYELAKALAADQVPVPVGMTAATVGDVSVTYAGPNGGGGVDAFVPGLARRVGAYRNRHV